MDLQRGLERLQRSFLAVELQIDQPQARQRADADAVLTGSVTDYKPSQKLMVLIGNTHRHGANGQTLVVTNPVVSLSGSEVTNEGPAFGLPDAQVISVSATVGVIAHVVDVRTGDVVWSDEFSYEGMDVQSALQATVSSLVGSLGKVMPALQARRGNP